MPQIANQDYGVIKNRLPLARDLDYFALSQVAGHLERGTIFDVTIEMNYPWENPNTVSFAKSRVVAIDRDEAHNVDLVRLWGRGLVSIKYSPEQYYTFGKIQAQASDYSYDGFYYDENGYLYANVSDGYLYVCCGGNYIKITTDVETDVITTAVVTDIPAVDVRVAEIGPEDVDSFIGVQL